MFGGVKGGVSREERKMGTEEGGAGGSLSMWECGEDEGAGKESGGSEANVELRVRCIYENTVCSDPKSVEVDPKLEKM